MIEIVESPSSERNQAFTGVVEARRGGWKSPLVVQVRFPARRIGVARYEAYVRDMERAVREFTASLAFPPNE